MTPPKREHSSEPRRRGIDATAVLIAAIASLPPTVASIAAVLISLNTQAKVEVVHKATNSLTERLVSVTKSDALQEGHTKGVADEKARVKGK